MNFKLISLALIMAGIFSGSAHAALALISREPFNSVKTLTSASPGSNFASVTGSFYARPVGPHVSGDSGPVSQLEGWSADIHDTANSYGTYSVTGSTSLAANGMACGWFFMGDFNQNLQQMTYIQITTKFSNGSYYAIGTGGDTGGGANTSYLQSLYSSSNRFEQGPAMPSNGWIFLAIAWTTSGSTTTFKPFYMLPGGSLIPLITGAFQTQSDSSGNFSTAGFTITFGENEGSNTSMTQQLRVGCPAIYSMLSTDTPVVPGDLVAPPTGPFNWYLNPATGSDTNDGTTAGTAWRSEAKLQAETSGLGLIPSNGIGPANIVGRSPGDILHIDCSGASLFLTTSLTIGTAGLTILETQTSGNYSVNVTPGALNLTSSTSGPYGIDPTEVMAHSGWSLLPGTSNVYKTTDGAATDLPACVVWEDAKWMYHPTGVSLSSNYSVSGLTGTTVQTFLDANAGSFWTDGTNLYLHTFESDNPNTNTHVIRRSRYHSSGGVVKSAVNINAPNVWWNGFVCAGTSLAANASNSPPGASMANDPLGAYCFQWNASTGETGITAGSSARQNQTLLSNFNINYYSKHGVGNTTGDSYVTYTRQNGTYGQAPATMSGQTGGASADVDFSGGSAQRQKSYFINCSEANNVNEGSYKSTAGTLDLGDVLAYFQHGNGPPFVTLSFTNCTWASPLSDEGEAVSVTCTNLSAPWAVFGSPANFDRCTITNGGIFGSGWIGSSANNFTCTNCILQSAGGNPYAIGNGVFEGCVFDLRGYPSLGNQTILKPLTSTTTLTIKDCLFITNAGQTWSPLDQWTSSNLITMDHNVYMPLAGGTFSASENYTTSGTTSDRNFSQWQALGFDLHSTVVDSPNLQTGTYVPASSDPCLTYGVNIGPLDDYTAAIYTTRETVGAFEIPHVNELNVNLSSNKSVGVSAYGYTATGQIFNANLDFGPTLGAALTVIDNLSNNPINGTFNNLPDGGLIVLTYGGTTYTLKANYEGGDGNDLILTVDFSTPVATDTPLLNPWALMILGAALFIAGSYKMRGSLKA